MERIRFEDWRKVKAITAIPDGPANLLLSLRRFPFVSVDRLSVAQSAYPDLQEMVRDIGSDLGHKPLTAVLCNAGIYRSKLIATHLRNDGLVELSEVNLHPNKTDVIGRGREFLSYAGLGFTEHGVAVGFQDPRPTESLLLCLAARYASKDTLSKIAAILDEGLPKVTQPQNPFSVIWLDGDEDDIQKWFSEDESQTGIKL